MLDSPPEGKADSAATMRSSMCSSRRRRAHRRARAGRLPAETISARVRQRCLDGGVVPLQGQREALRPCRWPAAWCDWRTAWRTAAAAAAAAAAPADVYALGEHEGRRRCEVRRPCAERKVVPAGAAAAASRWVFRWFSRHPGAPRTQDRGCGVVPMCQRSECGGGGRRLRGSPTSVGRTHGHRRVVEILIGVIVDPQLARVLVSGRRRAHRDHGGQRQSSAALDGETIRRARCSG